MKSLRFLAPLLIFVVVGIFLAVGLKLDPREVPSPLIDKPAPQFELPRLLQMDGVVGTADLRGEVWLLNVWASWCTACRVEHPLLNDLAGRQIVRIVGLNYKDAPADARTWLREFGNPYNMIAVDSEGEAGIDWGVYGVPETFVIDRSGVIRYKHIGPLDAKVLNETIVPLIRQLTG
ncbi:MAG TPA: DsbE family thiol:disulfide interchange protein [Gammaproteobacteria bacterium]|jgi:cytochrome c biogenesis protein CcmG/thiol:disulfide interchange protein DsbE|nr:DsbE family thiol:disulfide interchange protein [Acidiferrobacteraceae bacterium]MDP6551399.1 DsbE family thiol:disulfide interchange protein [Arenicellales bacterium]MDP6791738.1 DsbE family thiol:disulfide interchange protein [Arenicellales bacterium]MDP6919437.1 DsbE family thiol:disulfide interchange protein [Arenicellales bacterium]HCX87663.1 DsbE family thiol:disulfide interchange protein [Gammaproteobacteria bacterium]|tara:strand:- start:123 stop:653 length:531 start_codon:yes stop_codon:yes gene_type:complete